MRVDSGHHKLWRLRKMSEKETYYKSKETHYTRKTDLALEQIFLSTIALLQ
jgi:hypothetical protein